MTRHAETDLRPEAERQKILEAMANPNVPHTAIAEAFGMSERAVRRRRAKLPDDLVQAQEAKEVARADRLLDRMENLYQEALETLQACKDRGGLRERNNAIRVALSVLQLQAQLAGQLNLRPQVNITTAPQYIAFRATVLQELAPWPEAQRGLALRLVQLDAGVMVEGGDDAG